MIETDKLDNYILTTFSKITDQYGRSINISLASSTLKNIIQNNNLAQYETQNYDYIGTSATNFAISLILSKQYPKFNKQVLTALSKKLNIQRLHKVLNQEIHLKDYVAGPFLSDTITNIVGVFYSYFGIDAVEKLLKQAVIHIANVELNEAVSSQSPSKDTESAVYRLNLFIQTQKGTITTLANQVDKMWEIKLIIRLSSTSTPFSHKRIAANKQKAKQDAASDILIYFEKNPIVLEQLKQMNGDQEQILPIQAEIPTPTTCAASQSYMEMNNKELSKLLLGSMDIDDDKENQSNKRPRQNPFLKIEPSM